MTLPNGDADTGTNNLEVTVIIPVLDEEDNVGPLLDELVEAMKAVPDHEILFINDGSKDATLARLRDAMGRIPQLRVVSHETACGKSEALRTAARLARGRVLVTIDGDLQNDPADIPRLVEAFQAAERNGMVPPPGIVAGQRVTRIDPFPRSLVSKIANSVRGAILKDETKDTGCGFKVIRRDIFLALPFSSGLHRFLPALVKREGFSILLEPVSHRPRVAGVAKYNTWNRLWVGIGDMAAAWWMIKRYRAPESYVVVHEDGKDEKCSAL
ncbi:MAG: glycosyltransferase [Rhizobiales bacterium]|nr:glycosyltransferase [Hyphomicrobiales bacterium]